MLTIKTLLGIVATEAAEMQDQSESRWRWDQAEHGGQQAPTCKACGWAVAISEMVNHERECHICPACEEGRLETGGGLTERCSNCEAQFRRVAILQFAPELMMGLTCGAFRVVRESLPDDAELVNANFLTDRGVFGITIWSSNFEPRQIGRALPFLSPPWIEQLEAEVAGGAVIATGGGEEHVQLTISVPRADLPDPKESDQVGYASKIAAAAGQVVAANVDPVTQAMKGKQVDR